MNNKATPVSNHTIRDNRYYGNVGDFLAEKITKGGDLSIVSAFFTIYAYNALKEQLDQVQGLRFLFGEPRFVSSIDPDKTTSKSFDIEDMHLNLANRLNQKSVARECAEWIRKKVQIRSIRQAGLLHGKLYHISDGHREHAILGSSNFTLNGLGYSATPNIELNLVVDSDRDRAELKAWFDIIWNDEKLVSDVKEDVLGYLEKLYMNHSPEFIYYKTLYHIFEKFLSDQADESERFEQTNIVDTEIWKTLFDFQKDGAKGAIHKIKNHSGCILADSVGLGKTYTALAVIKYFELRNHRVLVLCPRKLRDNWTVYLAQNNSELNPFLGDRFNYTVLSHTDLSRESGNVGDIDLASFKWSNYDLVVIDESHNFRNNTKGKRDDDGNIIRKSRYERLLDDIIKGGVKSKVMLLSATPVNNNLKDLRNQIYIVTEGKDNVFEESIGIPSLKETLAAAQRTFTEWSRQGEERDTRGLIGKLSAGFFTLLDELTIARSRKHIERYYRSTMEQIGEFPERNKPKSIASKIDIKDEFPPYDQLNEEISNYKLSLFNPTNYVLPKFRGDYEKRDTMNFSQEKREHFLIGMMKVNFLKRLESSVQSFEITMNRTINRIEYLEGRIQKYIEYNESQSKREKAKNNESRDADGIELYPDREEEDEEVMQAFEVGGKLKIPMDHLDVEEWLKDLAQDKEQLKSIAQIAEKVTPERDAKLAELKGLIANKVICPTTNSNGEKIRKVIVFCAFADTASYLYEHLHEWAVDKLGVHIAMVSGGTSANKSSLGNVDYARILANFAPRAKQRQKMENMPQDEEIEILIATDCISEGQNLQDCDYLVNYDIHWNPVRIIQRYGRIDRIGSLNSHIQLVNFWPTPDLNKYINLKNRVEARMALVDIAATAQDNILQADDLEKLVEEEWRYRDKQLLRLKDEILDLEDFDESVSLNEFTLDDFRMDLAEYIRTNEAILRDAPLGLYAVVPPGSEHQSIKPGVIFCLKQKTHNVGSESINPLQPYFLIYIYDGGEVRYNFTSPKHTLEMFHAVCEGQSKAYSKLCKLFDRNTQNGRDMSKYDSLLKKAVSAIVDQFADKNAGNLLSGRGGKLVDESNQAKGDDDFELITWLIIMDN